jgi:F-type H+-transporting ATPase subunit b
MGFLTLLAAETHHAAPLIDLDGTIWLQLALFLVTLAVLSRLVFRPFLDAQRERHDRTIGARQEADRLKSQTNDQLEEYDHRILESKKLAALRRIELQQKVERSAQEMVAQARVSTEQRLAVTRAQLEKEAPAAERELMGESDKLARAIAEKVLGRPLSLEGRP